MLSVYYSTKLTRVISTFLRFTDLLYARLLKGITFINHAFGDTNFTNLWTTCIVNFVILNNQLDQLLPYKNHNLELFWLIYCVQRHFQQYFSYIMATGFSVEEASVPGENLRSDLEVLFVVIVQRRHCTKSVHG